MKKKVSLKPKSHCLQCANSKSIKYDVICKLTNTFPDFEGKCDTFEPAMPFEHLKQNLSYVAKKDLRAYRNRWKITFILLALSILYNYYVLPWIVDNFGDGYEPTTIESLAVVLGWGSLAFGIIFPLVMHTTVTWHKQEWLELEELERMYGPPSPSKSSETSA